MRFCYYLIEDLNFEPDGLQPCCNIRGVPVPNFPFSGGKINIREYWQHIAQVLLRLQDTPPPLCARCPHLLDNVEITGNLNELSGAFKAISFNQHRFICNCRCIYCSLWNEKALSKPYSCLNALKSIHSQQAIHPDCFMSWGGGEPTLLQDFEITSQWIYGKGYFQNIHTNALRHSAWIERLLSYGGASINISLDSADEHSYKEIKGVNGWNKVLDTLSRYVSASSHAGNITLKYIIMECNNALECIESFLDLCTKFGIKRVEYSFDFREVNSNKVSAKTINAAAYFISRCRHFNLACFPFFIDNNLQELIQQAEQMATH